MKYYPIPGNKEVIFYLNEDPFGKFSGPIGACFLFGSLEIKLLLYKWEKVRNYRLIKTTFGFRPLRFEDFYYYDESNESQVDFYDLYGYIFLCVETPLVFLDLDYEIWPTEKS